jgi:ribosome-binding protein aMBF1 (putative translation factor)
MPKTKTRKLPPGTTADGLQILYARFVNTPRLKRLLEEERQRVALGDLIRDLREKAGLTQAQLARKVHTSQSAIARIEDADYTGQKLGTIARVAAALGHRVEVNLVKVKA